MRPSKRIFYEQLNTWLSGREYQRVIDVGCADFKNQKLFKTAEYIGVDCDGQAITDGRSKAPRSVGVIAVLPGVFQVLRPGIADLCIATHLLDNLAEHEQAQVLVGLVNLNVDGGDAIINMATSVAPPMREYLTGRYAEVDQLKYRNAATDAWERMAGTASNPLFESIDRLTSRLGVGNYTMLMAHRKKAES